MEPIFLRENWMKAGFAERDITPKLPCAMEGYVARTGPATGVLDPIMARACVLEARLAIVVLDWCFVTEDFVRRVRRRPVRRPGHRERWQP